MENIHEIYERYLKGECNREELILLLQHFQDDGADPALLRRIEKVLQESEPEMGDSSRIEAVLQENHNYIRQHIQTEKPEKAVRSISTIYRYAAVIALFFILGLALYQYGLKPTSKDMALSETEQIIQPGGNKATVTLSDGRVLVLSEDQEGLLSQGDALVYADGSTISSLEAVQTVTLSTPRAGQYTVTLPDGTQVWLNAASEIVYPSRFDDKVREVTVKGEAYFDVVRDDNKPFVVHAAQQRIEVLGTQFNIQAYEDGSIQRTTLVNGSVSVASTTDVALAQELSRASLVPNKIMLKPGQQARSNPQGSLSVLNVETDEYVSWKDGIILLNSYELPEILQQLERWYDVEFGAIPSTVKTVKIFGMLQRDVPLNDVLKTLSDNYHVQFKINGRRVTMFGT